MAATDTQKITQRSQRRQVFCKLTKAGKEVEQAIGSAFVQEDGSISVYLDAFPANGRLVIR